MISFIGIFNTRNFLNALQTLLSILYCRWIIRSNFPNGVFVAFLVSWDNLFNIFYEFLFVRISLSGRSAVLKMKHKPILNTARSHQKPNTDIRLFS